MTATVPLMRLFSLPAPKKSAKERDLDSIGPRTSMGSKNVRIGDLVLVCEKGDMARLGIVVGGYRVSGRWYVQLGSPPGLYPPTWTRSSVPLRAVTQVWGKRGRAK